MFPIIQMFGKGFAVFFTLVVIYCIYGSCFSLMLGFAQIPYAAAKNNMFFEVRRLEDWVVKLH